MGKGSEQTFLQRGDTVPRKSTKIYKAQEKILDVISRWGNASQSHSEYHCTRTSMAVAGRL